MNHPAQGEHNCPVCAYSGADVHAIYGDPTITVECPNCSTYRLTRTADSRLSEPGFGPRERSRISYLIRHRGGAKEIDSSELEELRKDISLPAFSERVDNLIVHLAATYTPGESAELEARKLKAVIGCEGDVQAQWVLKQLLRLELLEGDEQPVGGYWRLSNASLTLQGWQRHDQLMKDGAGSRHAFIAMKFGISELDAFFKDHLIEGVKRTGFDLRRVDGPHQTAGLIDNRMRVEIRTSRFLVCDLSHGNAGAYWEAGFAEGLGRPVFYICDQRVFKDQTSPHRPHFDTNHQNIVVYDLESPSGAVERLVAMIRATLPGEATMEDA